MGWELWGEEREGEEREEREGTPESPPSCSASASTRVGTGDSLMTLEGLLLPPSVGVVERVGEEEEEGGASGEERTRWRLRE